MSEDVKKVIFISIYIILIIGLIIGFVVYFVDRGRKTISIKDIDRYGAKKEIEIALKNLSDEDRKAKIIKRVDTKEKVIALTFQGLSDSETNEKILDLITKYRYKANFFIPAISAAENSDFVKKIHDKGHRIGSNTLVPSSNMHEFTQKELIEDFVRTNVVFERIIGEKPITLLCNNTKYTDDLLKAAYASGHKMVVQPTKYLSYQSFMHYGQVLGYVSRLDRGSILTVKMDGVLEEGEHDQPPDPAKPAIDKQPGLSQLEKLTPEERLVIVVSWLLRALDRTDYKVVFVEDLESYRGTEVEEDKKDVPKAPPKEDTVGKVDRSPTQKPPASKPTESGFKGFTPGELEQLRMQNNGKKAREYSTIYTTEKALSYSFYGVDNEEVLNKVLNNLDVLGIKGTFFITKRDLMNHANRIRQIAEAGHEIGICLMEFEDKDFYSALNSILIIQREVKKLTQQTPTLVRYPYYIELKDEILEAVSSAGCTVVWQDVSIASSRIGTGGNLEAVLNNAFNEGNYTVRRGYIIFYRMDYYSDPNVIPDAMLKIAEDRIDTIAYVDEVIGNGSSYSIRPIGDILKGDKVYNYPVNDQEILASVKDKIYPGHLSEYTYKDRFDLIKSRYIGNPFVNTMDTLPGFTEEELMQMDKTGRFTDDPVLFLTFDDWASDKAINQLLYVLDKHGVKASFFIRTNYMQNNPNILRAIAEAGHDVGSHSDQHLPFAIMEEGQEEDQTNPIYHSLNEEEIAERKQDLLLSYNKLQYVIGDISVNDLPALTTIFRPPTLAMSREGMELILDMGFSHIVSGDFSTNDYEDTDPEVLADKLINGIVYESGREVKIQNGSVLIMHMSDFKQNPISDPNVTAKALDIAIPILKSQGYSFARLSDYLRQNSGSEMESGHEYEN